MNTPHIIPDSLDSALPQEKKSGFQINFKRVADRAIRHWYFVVIFLSLCLSVAWLSNRYSPKIYPIKASIIIKENDENAGAKFLYNNALLNPYRNFYNEIYIMKSYPLLQEVMENLHFDVSLYREGDIKTTEYYDPDFPIKFRLAKSSKKPYGLSMYLTVHDNNNFSLQYITKNKQGGKEFPALVFGDTIRVNGFRIFAQKTGDISAIKNRTFILRFNDPLSLAMNYSSRLNATWATTGSGVVNLEIHGQVVQKEIDFLNKFIERYQFYDVEKKNKVATMAINFLDKQLDVIADSLKLYEDQVENFKRKNVITNLDAETNRLFIKLQDFEDQVYQYKLTDNYHIYLTQLLTEENYNGIFTPKSVGIDDEVITDLINRLIKLQAEVDLYKSNSARGITFMQDNPLLNEKIKEINIVKNDILKTIDNEKKTEAINIAFIKKEIALVEGQLSRLPRTERELVAIKRNYSLKENLYVFLLQKRTEAGLSKASTTSDIVVVNPPMAYGPISPLVMQTYAIAIGSGLFIPFLFFVLAEVFNDKIQSREDIQNITSVPVVGGIGHNPENDPLIAYRKPRSAMSESFRALRSNLNYFTGKQEHKVFMVTSSIPGEGKSFTTLNLASVFAMAGKKTIIVGADLRKPKLFDALALDNKIGLSQFLSGMANKEDIIQASPVENLFLIAGGPMPPNPSELLLRPAMEKLMVELRKEYDYVIVDTPPLTLVTDAFVLAQYTDHTLFVVRQNFTPRAALRSLDEYFSTGKLINTSILFNDLRKSGFGYGYGGYGYGYGYNYGYGYYGKRKRPGTGYYEE